MYPYLMSDKMRLGSCLVISGYAQILGENGFDDREFYGKAIDKILCESQRLHTMVIELLEASKVNVFSGDKDFECINLEQLISNVCKYLEIRASKYHMDFDRNIIPLKVLGNYEELNTVFVNLLDNAINYGKPGSNIQIKGWGNDGFAFITIENQGSEITTELLRKIFEPFVRGKGVDDGFRGGTGLGLYICKTILEKHQGEISIESRDSTRVTVKIPLFNNSAINS